MSITCSAQNIPLKNKEKKIKKQTNIILIQFFDKLNPVSRKK